MRVIKKYKEPSGKLKFGNGSISQAMRRQYDKEQGIAMEKVLPEVVYTLPGTARVRTYLKGRVPHKTFDVQQCATVINQLLRKKGGYKIQGNSWDLNNAKLLLNGFEGLSRPVAYTPQELNSRNRKAADNFKEQFDINNLDQDSIYVGNLFYNDSPYTKQAFESGSPYNGTHEAVFYYDNGWKAYHVIGRDVLIDNLENLLGSNGEYGITALLQPLY